MENIANICIQLQCLNPYVASSDPRSSAVIFFAKCHVKRRDDANDDLDGTHHARMVLPVAGVHPTPSCMTGWQEINVYNLKYLK